MSYIDSVFVKTCEEIISHGFSDEGFKVRPKWKDGTPAHTKYILHNVTTYDLQKGIPVMTLRKQNVRAAIDEILWIYQKKSSKLEDLNSHVWDSWNVGDGTIGKAYGYQVGKKYAHHKLPTFSGPIEIDFDGIRMKYPSFDVEVKDDDTVWVCLDQIDAVRYDLRNNPASRSIMTNLYCFDDLSDMGLHPCAYSMTFNVTEKDGVRYLNGMLNQRSQDMLVANNWNVIQYSALLMMLAKDAGMVPGTFVHVIANAHIYDRHIPIVKELISKYHENKFHPNPTIRINPDVTDFYQYNSADFLVTDYEYEDFNHKIEVAI